MNAPDELAPSPPGVEVCSCDESLALRAELAAARAQLAGDRHMFAHRAFCPQCGAGIGFDEEGCCTSCGSTVCSMVDVASFLAAVGLRVVPMSGRAFADARQRAIEDAWRGGVDGGDGQD